MRYKVGFLFICSFRALLLALSSNGLSLTSSGDMNEWGIFNWRLATAVGLRQILDPGTAKVFGYNVYHLLLMFGLVLPTFTIVVLTMIGLYWWANDRLAVMLYASYAFQFSFCCSKILCIIRNSGALWECYESLATLTLAPGDRRGSYRHWSRLSALLSLMLVAMSVFVWCGWFACPFAFPLSGRTELVIEGSVGVQYKYRLNLYNLNFLVSDAVYNENFYAFYGLELIVLTNTVYSILLFDMIIVTMCSALCCRLQMVGDAFRMLGHSHSSQPENVAAGTPYADGGSDQITRASFLEFMTAKDQHPPP